MKRRVQSTAIGLLSLCLLAIWIAPVQGATVKHTNMVDLISQSVAIKAGTVVGLSDGFDTNGVPYTEVTLDVRESLMGAGGDTFTFRQYGLLAPRQMPDGRVNLNVTLDGWPSFKQSEEVVVFICAPGSITGLCTTVGLLQGKFHVNNGKVVNEINNRGLFQNVNVDPSVLTDLEQKLLNHEQGGIRDEVFLHFVRTAVSEQWIETGRMSSESQ